MSAGRSLPSPTSPREKDSSFGHDRILQTRSGADALGPAKIAYPAREIALIVGSFCGAELEIRFAGLISAGINERVVRTNNPLE